MESIIQCMDLGFQQRIQLSTSIFIIEGFLLKFHSSRNFLTVLVLPLVELSKIHQSTLFSNRTVPTQTDPIAFIYYDYEWACFRSPCRVKGNFVFAFTAAKRYH